MKMGKRRPATETKEKLDNIPLHSNNNVMNVAEIDPAVQGLLCEEHRRCLEVLEALERKAAGYPKGALNTREKTSSGKSYLYHYLVFREAGRVVNRHIPKSELPALRVQLEEREKCRKEIAAYRRRIAYLEKLLSIRRTRKGRRANPA
jgi:hypothetical protein